jgi:hypothetical protein
VTLPGAIQLPDDSWVRGRGLRNGTPDGLEPEFGLYLGGKRLQRKHSIPWPHHWIDWPDFSVPRDFEQASKEIRALYERAKAGERVEVACGGGVGRTGTVISCLAVLCGLSPIDAIAWARANYQHRAVETPWQRRWVSRFASS